MRQIRDTLGEDAILSILQASSELLEVNAETQKIRRKTEIAQRKDAYERSVYAVSGSTDTMGNLADDEDTNRCILFSTLIL